MLPDTTPASDDVFHPGARKLLSAAAGHALARLTWSQLASLTGLKPRGRHFNAGRKDLRSRGYVAETNGLVIATAGRCGSRHLAALAASEVRLAALWSFEFGSAYVKPSNVR